MTEAPRSSLHRLIRTCALSAIALLVPVSAPAFAEEAPAKAPIADAADKPSDDPLEGVQLDAPLGNTGKTKKGRRPAPAPAPNKPGRSGGSKSN